MDLYELSVDYYNCIQEIQGNRIQDDANNDVINQFLNGGANSLYVGAAGEADVEIGKIVSRYNQTRFCIVSKDTDFIFCYDLNGCLLLRPLPGGFRLFDAAEKNRVADSKMKRYMMAIILGNY
jgi:hypothetical protein